MHEICQYFVAMQYNTQMAQIANVAAVINYSYTCNISYKHIATSVTLLEREISKVVEKVLLCSLLHLRTDQPVISLNSPFWTASWGTKVIQTSFCQLKRCLGSVQISLVCVCLPERVDIEWLLNSVASTLHRSGICVIAIHAGVNAILPLSVSECPKVQLSWGRGWYIKSFQNKRKKKRVVVWL